MDKDLIDSLPEIFRSHATLTRMRKLQQAPGHFYVKPNVYYLKKDVMEWLKKRYSACPM